MRRLLIVPLLLVVVAVLGPTTSADNQGARMYASEEEFFNSQEFLTYRLLMGGLDCLKDRGLYSPDIPNFGDVQRYDLMSCSGIFRIARDNGASELFPEPANTAFEITANSIDFDLRNYFACLDGHSSFCGADGGLFFPNGLPELPRNSADTLRTTLEEWFFRTWCPIPDRGGNMRSCAGYVSVHSPNT